MKIVTFKVSKPHGSGLEGSEAAKRYVVLKRILDVVISLILIALFAPLLVLIVIAIRISSPGPVVYRQMRIGKDGKPFLMLKFRSMQVVNNPDLHRAYVQTLIKQNTQPREMGKRSLKLLGDERMTGVGKYLRKFGLDELPQLFNVLKGEMSVVGPRPSLPYEYEVYRDWHRHRLEVLPGITGLWQVNSHNMVAFDDMVRIDLSYIQHMNLWLDIKIMLLTPIEMILGRGTG